MHSRELQMTADGLHLDLLAKSLPRVGSGAYKLGVPSLGVPLMQIFSQ